MRGFRASGARLAVAAVLALAAGCGGGGEGAGSTAVEGSIGGVPRDVQVSWAANRESAVNAPGGGYRVYYGTAPGFDLGTASVVDVPYTSGPTAPTSATILALPPGRYSVRVVAYSALGTPEASAGAASAPSAEVTITVP